MDDTKLREQQDRGARADQILNDPLVKDAFEKMRSETRSTWENSKIDEVDVREDVFRMECLLKRLEEYFQQHIRTGNHARNLLSSTKDKQP